MQYISKEILTYNGKSLRLKNGGPKLWGSKTKYKL